ncbi:hypothetical protein GCM10010271_26970 [Streptomyces kurssanovii]|nr:hypothetical protein GCM10010271_26970 [Streptomyces kurssanovii]
MPVHVSDTTITVDLDGQIRVIRRTTDVPVRNVKADKPHKVSDVVQAHKHHPGPNRAASPGTRQRESPYRMTPTGALSCGGPVGI